MGNIPQLSQQRATVSYGLYIRVVIYVYDAGPILAELGALVRLRELFLDHNQLTGVCTDYW